MHFDITDELLLYKTIGGSRLYGTYNEDSDTDYRSICIPPLYISWGISYHFETEVKHNEFNEFGDYEIHSLAKFLNLASANNPNIIEILFTPEDKILLLDSSFKKILDNRDIFITKRAQHTFSGYAYAQLKRIKNHKAWLLNPIDHKPTREEFNLPVTGMLFDNTFINAALQLSDEQLELLGLPEEKHIYLVQEKNYLIAKRHYDQYQNWLTTRNPARAVLEAKYGFDTKHGTHLIRLLRMAKEIGEGKGVIPDRRGIDADFLKSIRFDGALTYDELIQEADKLKTEIDAAFAISKLPHSPDLDIINQLYLDVCFEKYGIECLATS